MTVKSFILAAQLCARSIFWWPREGQGALPEKSNTGQNWGADKLAVDHWRYVEGVLLRGWALAWYSRMFGVDCSAAAEWEWWRWSSSRPGYPVECGGHFREAFAHGWKHRCEVGR